MAPRFFRPTDPILAIDLDGGSNSPGGETVANAIDKTLDKYLNFGEVNSGFIVTPSNGMSTVTGFQITTANDATERDPTTWQLFGTNQTIVSTNHSTGTAETWTIIASGTLTLPVGRNTLDNVESFSNTTGYKSYRMVFTGVKNAGAANSMQIAEIEFFGTLSGTVTVPTMRLEDGATGDVLLSMAGHAGPGNLVTNPAALAQHGDLRIVVQSGTANLVLNQSNLSFRDGQGLDRTIYLPAINLPAGQRLDLWVSSVGSTYYGTAAQTSRIFPPSLESHRLQAFPLRSRNRVTWWNWSVPGTGCRSISHLFRIPARTQRPVVLRHGVVRFDSSRDARRHQAPVCDGAARLQSSTARFLDRASKV